MLLAVLLVDVSVVPVLLQEAARDWNAYAGAAHALETGVPLYPWSAGGDIRAPAPYPYLYPPPLAEIWRLGLNPAVLFGLKLASVAGVYPLVRRTANATRPAAIALVAVVLVTPPVLHDLILGNVMTFYLAALCIAVVFRGWIGATALGLLCAVAFKPAIGPLLLFLLLRRQGDFVRTVFVGAVVTVAFAGLVGPSRYFEYLSALPALGGLAAPFTGNVGLSSIAPMAGIASVAGAYLLTLAASRLDERVAASVAIAACVVAQPTLGLNYAVLLIPALVLLWSASRRLALAAAVVAPGAVILSTVGATAALIACSIGVGVSDRLSLGASKPVPMRPDRAHADT